MDRSICEMVPSQAIQLSELVFSAVLAGLLDRVTSTVTYIVGKYSTVEYIKYFLRLIELIIVGNVQRPRDVNQQAAIQSPR